ncbi:Pre protein translocase subunit Sec66-domain-containing protein [Phakopsora pachyrhizi]|uniref:Pre protein translocase subunit Sec66-domain-containing protein n=1 Tax=Phakopsora pachyrhizi TaxID=170000 RepID=A0AAV0BRN4_PHAPC|nr:Pre protein translocase subunit Sec66-domain-containing protein [Phakopsora pachyrhizi]CAH7688248.1 Pre protein translocase subunit Sec66-domain-containing protein [Phakopsora pachyrhizi]
MALPLYVPFGYITFLLGLLWLFSRYYRSRALRKKAPPPWFPEPHTARDVYISLLSLDPPPPQPVLIAALIARAMTGVKRIMSLKESKQAMGKLLQKGQIGDDLWERLLLAEKELEVELTEVVTEANEFSEGWGSVIFDIASEAAQTVMCQEIYKDIPKQRTIKANEFENSRTFSVNPGELRIVGSKKAAPAAAPATKTQPPPSAAKAAMLEAIKAAQSKQQEAEQKKQQTGSQDQSRNQNSRIAKSASKTDLLNGDESDSENERNSNAGKSAPPSASKKKKPKRKKK